MAEMESATVLAQIAICPNITFCGALDSLSRLTIISKASQVKRLSQIRIHMLVSIVIGTE